MKNNLSSITLGMAVAGACFMLIGCPGNQNSGGGGKGIVGGNPHNLAHFDCTNHTGENYEIKLVAADQVLKNLKDSVVFVCPGDTLSWTIDDQSFSIDVNFKDPYAADLFGPAHSHITSSNGHANSGAVQSQNNQHSPVYKYDLVASKGSTKFELDPHVIPTGN